MTPRAPSIPSGPRLFLDQSRVPVGRPLLSITFPVHFPSVDILADLSQRNQ